MVTTITDALVLLAASSLAGAVNSVAGGGSLITFPVLVWLGREPILANATNTVSLAPGSVAALYGFRRELVGLRRWIVWGTIPSLAGGILGALLLLQTPSAVFAGLVPYLILFATALFACSGPLHALARRKTARSRDDVPPWPPGPMFLFYHLLVSVYGGYFGAGIGIMMLAGLGLAGFAAIHRMIALRNYYAILINGIAAAYFIFFGAVRWTDAAVLTLGQIVGSLVGTRIARNLSPSTVRWVVVAIGVAMALSLFRRPV
ncbi:MAG: sulfite exporter TauE/SafE family protein [Deltaproteobacteria bacterium]|nr:MAG: sulfite exporter TauE/SafE family protein [Deltaproteobacteria bacterium]